MDPTKNNIEEKKKLSIDLSKTYCALSAFYKSKDDQKYYWNWRDCQADTQADTSDKKMEWKCRVVKDDNTPLWRLENKKMKEIEDEDLSQGQLVWLDVNRQGVPTGYNRIGRGTPPIAEDENPVPKRIDFVGSKRLRSPKDETEDCRKRGTTYSH